MKNFKISFIFIVLNVYFSNLFGQVNISQGLVAYYPFTGNAVDSTGNGNDGTVSGATLTTDRFGNANKAYSFNGTSDYINVAATTGLTNNFYSVSLWVKVNAYPASGSLATFFSLGSTAGDQASGLTNNYFGSTGLTFVSYTSTTSDINTTISNPPLNQWVSVILTRDSASMNIYVNGVLDASIATNHQNPSYTSSKLTIGARYSMDQFFQGSLDDIRFYDRVLNGCEIASLAEVSLNNGLIASYPFSGNSNDASGNGNNGTVNGATLTTDRFGNANSAYYFNGTNSHITLPSGPFLNNNYSYSIWIKPYANSSAYTIMGIGNTQGDQTIQLVSPLGLGGGGYNIGSPSTTVVHSGIMPSLNTWYHIVLTRDNSNISMYVNGILTGTSSTSGTTPNYGTITQLAEIGMRESANVQFFNGVIDDIRIYNRALTDCEVRTLADDIPPLTANAGSDQSICTNSTSLSGNTPSIGSGTWSLVSGSGSISNPSSTTSAITNLGQGTNVFRWTITYDTLSAYDEVNIYNGGNLNYGLLASYPFSGNANDASGNGNNGTVNGATLTTDRFGNANSAYQFNGVNNYISLPSAPLLNSNYSYSLWVKISSLTSVYQLFDIGGSTKDFGAAIHNTNGFQIGAYNTNSSLSTYVSNTLPNLNQWYHIVMTRDATYLKLYINGSLAGSTSVSGLTQAFAATGNIAYLGIRNDFTEPLN